MTDLDTFVVVTLGFLAAIGALLVVVVRLEALLNRDSPVRGHRPGRHGRGTRRRPSP